MSDGSPVKIWKGFTFGSLMSTAFTLGTFLVGVIGVTITLTSAYGGIMQRFKDDERTTYWNHHELMGEVCQIRHAVDKGYTCPPLPPYRDGRAEAAANKPPG